VFGSVRPGEEKAVLAAARAVLALGEGHGIVVVPRHPERASAYLQAGDIPWMKWSEARAEAGRAVLVDTVGELLGFYRMADVAFVGGSISRHGGHNPLEPARFGVPLFMGPHRENCRDLADPLVRAGALLEAREGEALASGIVRLLANDEERRRRGEAGRAAVFAGKGAAARCVNGLVGAGVLQAVQT
jgi:3-deoxy-D-manno-octulosonic-acid transferase